MIMLVSGLLLFACVHFVPSLAPGLKSSWQGRLGEGGYKGTFSLLLLLSFGLMIYGWRSTQPAGIYAPPADLRVVALVVIALGFIVMGASNRNSRLRLLIRHPQLTGLIMWSGGHLLLNGDQRSLVLFGGLGLWAIVEIFAINHREGVWIKEPPPSWGSEVVTLLIAVIVIAVFTFAHPWLSGVAIV